MVWIWMAVTVFILGLFVVDRVHDRDVVPCHGPGPHGGHLFVVPVRSSVSVLCDVCKQRRNANYRQYLLTIHKEEKPYDYSFYESISAPN